MTRKPTRRQFPAGRQGAAKYQAALRKWSQSQARRSQSTAPDTRSETQRRRDTRRSSTRHATSRETPAQRRIREAQAAANKARKEGKLANIPPQEGSYDNPDYGKKISDEQLAAFNRGASGQGTRDASTGTSSGQSDSSERAKIRAEYDRLRKSGDIKGAEEYGKRKAKELAAKAPKNPMRVPQGAERKDRFSRDLAELRAMRRKSATSGTTGVGPVKDGDAYAAGVRAGRQYSEKEERDIQRYGSRGGNATTRNTANDRSRRRDANIGPVKDGDQYARSLGDGRKEKSGNYSSQPTRSRSRNTDLTNKVKSGKKDPNKTPKANTSFESQPTRSRRKSAADKIREMLKRRRGY